MDEVKIGFLERVECRHFLLLAPTEKTRSILERTIQEAKDKISKVRRQKTN